jgi:hypothetical protein
VSRWAISKFNIRSMKSTVKSKGHSSGFVAAGAVANVAVMVEAPLALFSLSGLASLAQRLGCQSRLSPNPWPSTLAAARPCATVESRE